jgi:hypothetical protein
VAVSVILSPPELAEEVAAVGALVPVPGGTDPFGLCDPQATRSVGSSRLARARLTLQVLPYLALADAWLERGPVPIALMAATW